MPRALARIVDRCLAKNPADRFQSALDLRHSLEEVQQDVDSGDSVCGPRSRSGSPPPTTIRNATLVGVAALVAVIGVWLGYVVRSDVPRSRRYGTTCR